MSLDKRYSDIIYRSSLPWLKIDLNIDTKKIWSEIKQIKSYSKQSSSGWQGLAYRGISSSQSRPFTEYGYSSESEVPYIWTELSELAPTLRDSVEELFPSAEIFRIKLNRLVKGGRIPPHSDSRRAGLGLTEHSPYSETDPYTIKYLTLALDWPEDVEFYLAGKRIPIKTGDIFLLDFSQIHEVYNNSGFDRVSAIITGRFDYSVEFKKAVVASYEKYANECQAEKLTNMPYGRFLKSRFAMQVNRVRNKLARL